jgi:hypothetical protein
MHLCHSKKWNDTMVPFENGREYGRIEVGIGASAEATSEMSQILHGLSGRTGLPPKLQGNKRTSTDAVPPGAPPGARTRHRNGDRAQ